MPDAASPTRRRRIARHLAALPFIVCFAAACAHGGDASPGGSAESPGGASPSPVATSSAVVASGSAVDGAAALCTQIGVVESRIAALRAVELRLPNRVALDIELGKLQAAFVELAQSDLGPFAAQLEGPLTRLGYRLGEVELAVEDFRTNSRPQRAVTHVETDARTFAEELASFAILARC
jgi:hypothetical protein